MNHRRLTQWLTEDDPKRLEQLWAQADNLRKEHVGDAVHLRGLIEISNHCVRRCAYCGINATNSALERYRMSHDEILQCAEKANQLGYGTLVIQAGEDYGLTKDFISEAIREIKRRYKLTVTLSLGERSDDELEAWRRAGANRYLIRFETSNRELYDRIHPPLGEKRSDRFETLRTLRELGYEIGSGMLVGVPGQTYDDLVGDLECIRELKLHMIGLGPYIPHPLTTLGENPPVTGAKQVPNTALMANKAMAVVRIVRPDSNIPTTTAVATLDRAKGYEQGLQRGANVIMPNLTPAKYRRMYEIYPSKMGVEQTEDYFQRIRDRIEAIGRTVGTGAGDSPAYRKEHPQEVSR